MEKTGKYIYCIIAAPAERNFGPLGVGSDGNEVLTISYDDLSMVVSNHSLSKLVVNKENLLTHERAIEKVCEEFDSVLPVRFGTIASSADEIRNLLDRRYREFKTALKYAEHKIELGVKGLWKDMGVIFKEILSENKEIKKAKNRIQKEKAKKNIHPHTKTFGVGVQAKVKVGKDVFEALQKKKGEEAEKITAALRRTVIDYKLNKTIGDDMFINASFLVDKGREKEFDNIMDDLSQKYEKRARFMYAGPLPVFNFVNIAIYPEEWEK
ncbi:MAG: GvpL/GvpF family gas vesicle protein [Candidatus Omnitrophica bacterium]|nr:GvpL/GvpF family gas vesicle protein [Candidatus Omnitrophota bacterium]